jgi:hypothetical protein
MVSQRFGRTTFTGTKRIFSSAIVNPLIWGGTVRFRLSQYLPAQQSSAVALTRPRWPWRRPNWSNRIIANGHSSRAPGEAIVVCAVEIIRGRYLSVFLPVLGRVSPSARRALILFDLVASSKSYQRSTSGAVAAFAKTTAGGTCETVRSCRAATARSRLAETVRSLPAETARSSRAKPVRSCRAE